MHARQARASAEAPQEHTHAEELAATEGVVLRGRNFLMTPGPTNVPERVVRAMQRAAVDLGSPAFLDMCRSLVTDLGPVFKTDGAICIYAANGHGAWEAALVNVLSPGDLVLVQEAGHFTRNWSKMAERHGAVIECLPGDWRRAIDPDVIEARLRADTGGAIKAVLTVQTDTATGITSDVAAMRAAIDAAGHPALLMVDTIASLGTTDFRMDEWGVDVAVAACQKALMTPPGLSFTAAGPRALEAARTATMPRDYWDWATRLEPESYRWFCGTAPEHLLFALREALDMIAEEGLEAGFRRQRRLAEASRAAVEVWAQGADLEFNALVPAERSDSVTTVLVHPEDGARRLLLTCRDRFNVSLGGGLGDLRGRAFRIGHMGDNNEPMILGTLGAIEAALLAGGFAHGEGGVQAAVRRLADPG